MTNNTHTHTHFKTAGHYVSRPPLTTHPLEHNRANLCGRRLDSGRVIVFTVRLQSKHCFPNDFTLTISYIYGLGNRHIEKHFRFKQPKA